MPNDLALYVLAQQLGLPLQRWVKDAATLQQVAYFAQQAGALEQPPSPAQAQSRQRRRGEAAMPAEVRLDNVSVPPGLLSQRHVQEADRMSRLYPMLYVFENSIREFIDGHLTAAYGADWWDDTSLILVSRPVRDTVERAKKAEAENRYHAARNARPIYYTTLGNLSQIVQSRDGWAVFKPPRFPRPTWFPELIESFEVSRNIVAHMNPLQPRDVRALQMHVENWFKQTAGDQALTVP